jgi:hypothetical protein
LWDRTEAGPGWTVYAGRGPGCIAVTAVIDRFVIAYCRAYVPRVPDDAAEVDLTRWTSECS